MGYNLLIDGIYWGYNRLIDLLLTSWDIQVFLYVYVRISNVQRIFKWLVNDCNGPSQVWAIVGAQVGSKLID